jgi:hypothetical protein
MIIKIFLNKTTRKRVLQIGGLRIRNRILFEISDPKNLEKVFVACFAPPRARATDNGL